MLIAYKAILKIEPPACGVRRATAQFLVWSITPRWDGLRRRLRALTCRRSAESASGSKGELCLFDKLAGTQACVSEARCSGAARTGLAAFAKHPQSSFRSRRSCWPRTCRCCCRSCSANCKAMRPGALRSAIAAADAAPSQFRRDITELSHSTDKFRGPTRVLDNREQKNARCRDSHQASEGRSDAVRSMSVQISRKQSAPVAPQSMGAFRAERAVRGTAARL